MGTAQAQHAGAGVTYNDFRSLRLDSAGLERAMGLPPGTVTSARTGSRWAPVLNVGVNHAVDRHWGISASVSFIPLKLTTRMGRTALRSVDDARPGRSGHPLRVRHAYRF